jgi:NRAMP (natural resistance-associated macrophage protein)-like metal ion transporter
VVVIVITIGILSLQELGQKIFECIFGILVLMMFVFFSINFWYSSPPFGKIMDGLIPNIPDSLSFTGVIGAIIMPQNIFLHSSLVQTRKSQNFSDKTKIRMYIIETVFILFISCLINFTICSLFAQPKYKDVEITLENVGDHLVDFLPSASKVFWGLGLFASGISSTASGALTGQYLMNGIFNFQVSRIKRIVITR